MFMSQVRKYQPGGTAPAQEPPKPKVGKFTINGKSLEGQTAIDKILAAYGNSSTDTWMGSMAVNAIKDGNEAVYNSLDNSIQIVDNNGNDITNKYLPKRVTAKVSDSNFKKRWQATFGNVNDSFRRSGLALRGINADPEKVEEPDNRVELRRGNGWFDYIDSKDDKGKAIRVYDTNSSFNKDNFEIIRGILDYMTDTEDVDSKYKYSAWKSASDREQLRNLANEITASEGGAEGFLNTLRSKIESGKPLTDADIRLLNLMGFSKEASSSAQVPQGNTSSPATAAAREAVSVLNPGNESMYESMGITSTVGDDGRTRITGSYNGKDLSQGTWLLGGDYNWFDPKYKWLHNGVLYEGGEEQDKTKNYDLFNAVNGWFQNQGKTSQEWWDHAKGTGIHFSGEEGNNPFYDFDNTAYYDTAHNGALNRYIAGLNLPAIAINDFTGAFDNVPEGTSIYGYVDPTKRDAYGTMGNVNFFSIDQAGNIADWKQPYGLRPTVNQNGLSGFSSRDESNGNNFVYHRFNLGNEDTENTILTTSTLDEPGRKFYLKREGRSRELDPNRIAELMSAIREGRITRNDDFNQYYKIINTPVTGSSYVQVPEYKGYTKVEGGLYRQDSTGKLFYRGAYNSLYPYTPKKKEGGVIETPKFQYGGGINGSNNTLNIDNTAKHNIDKAHKMNGSDGGLTSAERAQVIGALGDLVGVGVSFIPGVGNIAGAATGAAASTTRFIGDIAQDGFQGKDALNYLFNLGLDATSLILPAVGKTAKGAKALKTIKSIAEPLMITAGAMGLGETASVLGKLASGEKLTSKDTTTLIHGLSKMTLGTSAAVSVGKEAKTLAKGLQESNKAALETVKDIKVGGKQNTLTNKEVFDLVNGKTENEAVTAIAEKLGLKEPSAEVLSEIKSKFGISNIEKGVLGKVVDKVGKRAQKVTTDTGEVDAKSGFSYFMNPIARHKGLNNYARGLSADQVRAANEAVRTSVYTDVMPKYKAQTIAQLAASPAYSLDNVRFGNRVAEAVPMGTFGGRRMLREPLSPYVVPETTVTVLPKIKKVESPFQSRLFGKMRGRLLNPGPVSIQVKKPGRFNIAEYNRVMREYWNSRKYVAPLVTEVDPTKLYFGIHSNLTLPQARPISQIRWTPTVEAMPIRDHNGVVEVMTKSGVRKPVRKKEGGIIPKFLNGGIPLDKFKTKLSPILDLSSAVAQSLAIGRSYDWQREANAEMKKRQFQAPQLIQQRLDLSPIEHKYQLAEEPLRKFKNVSSDNIVNMAGNLAKTEKLSNLEMQKGADISNYINQYNQQYTNTENQQRQMDAQMANEKSAYLTNLNSREKLLNAQELNDKWANVWNTYSQQFRQNVRDAEQGITKSNYEFDMQDALNSYNLDHDAYIKDSNIYKTWLNEKKTNDKIDPFETWVTNSNDNYLKYKELLEKEKEQQHYLNFLKKRKELDQNYSWLLHMKKGGKLRSTSEELTIQGDKSAKRAVIRMNDHLQKMLLQLMK